MKSLSSDNDGDVSMEDDPKRTIESAKKYKSMKNQRKQSRKPNDFKKLNVINPTEWDLSVTILVENNETIKWERLLRKFSEINSSNTHGPIHSKKQGTIIGFCVNEQEKTKALSKNKVNTLY